MSIRLLFPDFFRKLPLRIGMIRQYFPKQVKEVETRSTEYGYLCADNAGNEYVLIRTRGNSRIFGNERPVFSFSGEHISSETELINVKDQTVTCEQFSFISDQVIQTWPNIFPYTEETETAPGFRKPQIGAIHAFMAHLTVDEKAATIVMPTGTGKTDTMTAIVVARGISKVLVVVPNNALRTQIANQFIRFNLLRSIIENDIALPVVGVMTKKPRDRAELETFISCCNVVVTTVQIVGTLDENLQIVFANRFQALFLDEAHHVAAKTWSSLKSKFVNKIVVQFTATPFRRDGRRIDGKIIYNYPLGHAQRDGYFRTIDFIPVRSFSEPDRAIAAAAVARLRNDLENGYDHLVMARVESIGRIPQIMEAYSEFEEFHPVAVHSNLSLREQRQALEKINSRESRIVICVDMFGEGYDQPELKIAAIHDPHKSLGITLQFTGRFVRSNTLLGNAAVIANVEDKKMDEALKTLYSQDADWNVLLQYASERVTGRTIEQAEIASGFTGDIDKIPPQNLYPPMSAVIFKSNIPEWHPTNIENVVKDYYSIFNADRNIMVIVQRNCSSIKWGKVEELIDTNWDLTILYWNSELQLLYICSTQKDVATRLAEAVLDRADKIMHESIFRCISGVNRIQLLNIGVNNVFQGPVSYRMYAGPDILDGWSAAQRRNTQKANLFGVGYEDGEKTSYGCSYRGKVWARKVGDLLVWKEWCDKVGAKVINENLSSEELIKGVLIAKKAERMPSGVPITVEWPLEVLDEYEQNWTFTSGALESSLLDCDIKLLQTETPDEIQILITSSAFSSTMKLRIWMEDGQSSYQWSLVSGAELNVQKGRRTQTIQEWFNDNPPTIRYADGSFLQNNYITEVPQNITPESLDIVRAMIQNWDWSGVNIRIESCTHEDNDPSIQFRVITWADDQHCQILFDDDDKGEAADVIRILADDESRSIAVDLFHCKYSHEDTAGARVKDLYEVCGQAQKSIHWRENFKKLFYHMKKREQSRISIGRRSRFIKGGQSALEEILQRSTSFKFKMNIWIVQPGLSKNQATNSQLELLAATENYLRETMNISFNIVGSE